ncbi:MAG: TlpA disulfide reductase family protein [Planctomycetota bacterium]|jgi:thiol-disulfide isomerase/thioredoxin
MARTTFTLAVAAALAATSLCYAGDEEKTLSIGDPAPAIDVAHWVKGDQIDAFEDDHVYVVEFWATWCGPCVASMPHISELQEKYADYDVRFVGISDEPLQTVVNFLFKEYKRDGKIQNDRTHYTLTTDPDRSCYGDYMTAAGQSGIPTAFIVGKDGHVEWIGHPMTIDEPLEAVVKDSWDRAGFKTKWEKENQAKIAASKIMSRMRTAANAENWDEAIAAMDELIALGDQFEGYKVQKFMLMLGKMNDADAAYALGSELMEAHWDDAMMLNQLAWFTVDEKGIEHRDLDFALRAAARANELTKESDAGILDTLARVHFEKGELADAVKWQTKAVESMSGDEPFADDLRDALKRYEKAAGR